MEIKLLKLLAAGTKVTIVELLKLEVVTWLTDKTQDT